jgi:hypothetical protein
METNTRKFFDKSDKGYLMAEYIKKQLPAKYRDLYKAFLPQEANALPPYHSYVHMIELVPGSQTPFSQNHPLSPMELKILKRWLDVNLAKEFIRPSKSNTASSILLI